MQGLPMESISEEIGPWFKPARLVDFSSCTMSKMGCLDALCLPRPPFYSGYWAASHYH